MTTNREAWLNQIAQQMAPRFEAMGFPLPAFRASVGWPSTAQALGECWDRRVSGDGHFEIFINPGRADSEGIACTLAHELIHAAVGLQEGHKGKFAAVALELGFARPLTHASATTPEKLAEWVRPIIEQVGNIPHAAITMRRDPGVTVKPGVGIVPKEAGEGEAPRSSRPKTQTTRMRKCQCAEQDCGYTVRVTAKWLEVGPPHCPLHGAMRIEDDSAGD